MINKDYLIRIEKLLSNKKIVKRKLLSNSFGINCEKLSQENQENYITKYYVDRKNGFNAIESETKNLIFLNNLNLKLFPKVYSNNNDFLLMSFIENNELQPNDTKKDLLEAIVSLHSIINENFGFGFDTQIGGLRQINKPSGSWVNFYRDLRLGYIFEKINSSDPMDNSVNKKIELLLNNIHNFIPDKPKASLLHGDMWEGNILFNNYNFVGFIDPGSFFGHNELEIAYLKWFNPNFIGESFIDQYSEILKIDKEYKNYEAVYQLYYSLLNVYLWDRAYIRDVERLLNIIKI